jgi:DNA replication protein DnaC
MTTPKTETKSLVLLQHHLKQLKLPTMNAECETVAQRCARENVDHLGFLLQLCELELIERERKSGERRLKSARFPAYKTLDEFDFDARPSVNKPLVLELARGDYLDQRQNVLFVGNSGTGKTHLATGLAVIACAQGKRVRFWRVTELITTLLEAKEERSLLRLRASLKKLDLLIVSFRQARMNGFCLAGNVAVQILGSWRTADAAQQTTGSPGRFVRRGGTVGAVAARA